MITNDPNTNLIEAMKEKLPLKGKLADMLMPCCRDWERRWGGRSG